MPQVERELAPHRSARQFFGAELRHWRRLRNLSQADLAARVHVSADQVAKLEKAVRFPTATFAKQCDVILETGGILHRLWPLVDHERLGSPPVAVSSDSTDLELSVVLAAALPGARLDPLMDDPTGWNLRLPPGRVLPAVSVAATVLQAASSDLERVSVSSSAVIASCSHAVRRRLLVIEEMGEFNVRYFATDQARASIPSAYELDDLTLGMLWAACGTDDALLADDAGLAESRTLIKPYEQLQGSAVSREAAANINPISQMWLGSDFCARYIWRSLEDHADVPLFWTREQRGEEASTWLLYRHKYQYLCQTWDRFGSVGSPLVRVFCIPEAAIRSSFRAELVVLLLAVALMESFGIHTHVVADAEFENFEGFVLVPGRQLIVANWMRGHGLWHVDTHSAVTPEVNDAAGYGRHHSATAANDAAGRLALLAAYLDLDWPWLRRRCADLAAAGIGGLIRPRSRLLGTAGIDRACRFVGGLR